MDLSVAGLASNFDWKSLVTSLANAERTPETRLRFEQQKLNDRNALYSNVKTLLTNFNNALTTVKDSTLFDSRTTSVTDATIATATSAKGTPIGDYKFTITQLATTARQVGTTDVGSALNGTNDVSSLVLSNAKLASTITAGTFTVNGKQITIATTDTLKSVFDAISTATGGTVTASYDPTNDTIKLASASEIVVGSSTDSSNFLQAAKLVNNGTGAVESYGKLGAIRSTDTLGSANFATTLSDGGSGAGAFKINGVTINFNKSTDTVADVLKRINASAAGVSASYDTLNDRFNLVNSTTGDIGVALEDVTGNFLTASGLKGGTLSHGKNLLYKINDGGTIVSNSNTITEATSGISGLSVTALTEGSSTTVKVAADTTTIKNAITSFVNTYNQVQQYIDSQTSSTTDATGKVTAGVLATDSDAYSIATSMRSLVSSASAGSLKTLSSLGIDSNGYDNQLAFTDTTKLDSLLTQNLGDVKTFFTNTTSGMATSLSAFMTKTIGDDGTLIKHQDDLTKQSASIDTQVADLEKIVLAHSAQWSNSFVSMETAQAKMNQQLAFLKQRFPSS